MARVRIAWMLIPLLGVLAAGTPAASETSDDEGGAAGSNPLASVSKVDLEWEFLKDSGSDINDFALNGSTMLHPRLKFVYELHYQITNRTGRQENDWESLVLKPIFFRRT